MYRKKIIFDKKEKQGTFYAYLRGILILFGSMYIDIILQAQSSFLIENLWILEVC